MASESDRLMSVLWQRSTMAQRFELSRLVQEYQLTLVCLDIGLFDRQRIAREQEATRVALAKLVHEVMGGEVELILGR